MSNRGRLLTELYRLDATSGWTNGMRAASHALLAPLAIPAGPILDVGCGGGVFTCELAELYQGEPVVGIDLEDAALQSAASVSGVLELAKADAHRLPFADGSFSLVTALDSLDQSQLDTRSALAEIRRVLRPDGLLLVRVSAYAFLQGPHDHAFNTGHRYGRSELVKLLDDAGLVVLRTTYANSLLAPPVVMLRLLQRWNLLPFSPAIYGTGALDRIVAYCLRLEARVLDRINLPFGISLFALAHVSGLPESRKTYAYE